MPVNSFKPISETTLRAALRDKLAEVLPNAVVLIHEEDVTKGAEAGVPDMSVTHGGKTLWIECKYGTMRRPWKSRDIQQRTAIRLARHGLCFYLLWEQGDGDRRTVVVHPKYLYHATEHGMIADGFNHQFVANLIRGMLQPEKGGNRDL